MSDFETVKAQPTYRSFEQGIRHCGTPSEAESTYVCPTCGAVVAPYHVKLSRRYLRRTCPCELERQQRQQLAMMRLEWVREQASTCYNWLSLAWNDLPLVEKSFETFVTVRDVPSGDDPKILVRVDLSEALRQVTTFVVRLLRGEQCTLILSGECGTGKTHLLASICNYLRQEHRVKSRFCSASDLHTAIALCYQEQRDHSFILQRAITTPFLAIDDVGASKWTEARQQTYESILDGRTKAGLPTAISTNSLANLEQFVGERAHSRLSIGRIDVGMHGPDYRKEM